MSEFLEYVLWILQRSLILVLLAGVLAVAAVGVIYYLHKRKYKGERKFPWGKTFLLLVFLGYFVIVFYATMMRWTGFFHREWNLHLFRAWREAWNNFSVKNWANVLLNVAMFGPLGFLLPLMGKKFRKWYVTIPVGFGTSLAIELIQLALGRGICDVDDLFCNTLGAIVGYFAIMAILSLFNEKGKRCKSFLTYVCLTLIPVVAIGSIFASYHLKEYGNLPYAPAFTSNTKSVQWILDCELPEVDEKLAVYRTQTRSHGDCDAFAEDFKEIIQTEYDTVSYYQEAAYYMDHGSNGGAHFLYVNYLDQGYEYTGLFDDEVWLDTDRKTVEAALSKFPVTIPEASEFVAEGDGWYSFTADCQIDGAVLMDGVLRVRLAEGSIVCEIKNGLLSYTYYDIVAVISPEEAYNRLCQGWFSDNGFVEHLSPSEVLVLSCTLDYQIDTKGFYQPVYMFELLIPDEGTLLTMVPAMK